MYLIEDRCFKFREFDSVLIFICPSQMYTLLSIISINIALYTFLAQFFLFCSIVPKLTFQIKILRFNFPHISNPDLKYLFSIVYLHLKFVVSLSSHWISSKIESLKQSRISLIHFCTYRSHHRVIVKFKYLLMIPILFGIRVRFKYYMRLWELFF